MTVFELFCGLLTHLFSFSIFFHARCKSDFCSISDSHERYLKGQTGLLLQAETGIIDHGVITIISVEQRAKVLVFFQKNRSSPLEMARKSVSNLEVNLSMNYVSVHRKQ